MVVLAAHAAFGAVVFGSATIEDLEAAGQLQVSAGREDLEALLAVCDSFSLMFPIVTP